MPPAFVGIKFVDDIQTITVVDFVALFCEMPVGLLA